MNRLGSVTLRPNDEKKNPAGNKMAASGMVFRARVALSPLRSVASMMTRETRDRMTRTPAWACPARWKLR